MIPRPWWTVTASLISKVVAAAAADFVEWGRCRWKQFEEAQA